MRAKTHSGCGLELWNPTILDFPFRLPLSGSIGATVEFASSLSSSSSFNAVIASSFFIVKCIILHVRFSIRCPFGSVPLALAYAFQTCVASGSFFAISSGGLDSGGATTGLEGSNEGRREMGNVGMDGVARGVDGMRAAKKSSLRMSATMSEDLGPC
jgi:hypothetical protein